MKKIIKKKTLYKTIIVEDGEEEIIKWLADDGTSFYERKKCLEYEKNKELENQIKSVTIEESNEEDPSQYFYYPTDETLDLHYPKGFSRFNNVYFNGEFIPIEDRSKMFLPIKTWVGSKIDYNGDYANDEYFYTLDFIIEVNKKYLEELEDIKKEIVE